MICCWLFLLWSLSLSVAQNSDIFLPPVNNGSSSPNKLVVLVPGGLVPINTYVETCVSVQNNSETSLWVAIIHCLADLCDPLVDLNWRINSAIDQVKTQVQLKDTDIFILGHSLGGVGARHFIDSFPGRTFGGLGFYGTQYNGDSENFAGTLGYPIDLKSWPIPMFALTGELDFVPYSHLALLYRQLPSLSPQQKLQKPLIVIPGMDHSAFCPGFHVKNDIVQEIDEKEAVQLIGQLTAAWIDVVSLPSKSTKAAALLNKWITSTKPIVQPYMKAIDIEQEWCYTTQKILSGTTDYGRLAISMLRANSTYELETLHTSYEVSGNLLKINDVSYPYYEGGFLPLYVGAKDIACKSISSDRLKQQLNITVDSSNTCKTVNTIAVKTALQLLQDSWPAAVARWQKQGKTITLLDDQETYLGPQWVLTGLTWDEEDKTVNIQSPNLRTSLTSPIYPGNFYCKALSPAKVIEWITTASLTYRYL